MKEPTLTILNIGIDRALLNPQKNQEAQLRQLFYCDKIPARIVHLVKAPCKTSPLRLDFDTRMSIVPCVTPHWSLFIPLALWHGAKLVRKEHFDFIQVQDPHLTGVVGALLSYFFKIPLICGLFSDEIDNPRWVNDRFLNHIANGVGKFILRRSRAVRTNSLAVVKRIEAGKYCSITFIPFLVTLEKKMMERHPEARAVRENLLGGKKGPLLLAVSRLEREKNLSMMLRAVAATLKERPDTVLAIAGAGTLDKDLYKEAEKLLPGHMRWLGWIQTAELGAYYQASDLFLISSNRESAARVLSESLFAGTPVLSTDTAGASEIVKDGVSGRIVPIGDTMAFTQALLQLTSDLSRLKQMGQAGQENVKARTTEDEIATALRDFYRKAKSVEDGLGS